MRDPGYGLTRGTLADLAWEDDPVLLFKTALQRHGLLLPGAAKGVYARGPVFERVVGGVSRLIGRLSEANETIHFPPVLPLTILEGSAYHTSFPHLAATVHCFCGDDEAHAALIENAASARDWTAGRAATSVALAPASCYPVYELVAARGALPPGGVVVDASSWCFRHEPSDDPARMLGFRQREHVCLATLAQLHSFEAAWVEQAKRMFRALDLPVDFRAAEDPFFGRLGGLLARSQRAGRQKYEFLAPVSDPRTLSALGSMNQHGQHFARAFNVRLQDGAFAYTACAGFGLDRVALALFRRHGFLPDSWPEGVRAALRLAGAAEASETESEDWHLA